VLENAKLGVRQLIEMVSQMLDVSRLEAGKMELKSEPCDLVALARDVLAALRPLAESRSLSVTPDSPVSATCDHELIRRVIGNLVGNAIKFTPTNGHIAVAVIAEGSQVRVTVTDDGSGIPSEKHKSIFEKFGQVSDRNRRGGFGLGLTFCKMAVEAHGGAIGLENVPDHGSTFWFTLPVATPESPAPEP
jgi:signal transduction histidine kinase